MPGIFCRPAVAGGGGAYKMSAEAFGGVSKLFGDARVNHRLMT